jgi:diadenosine tetraphosphate (Ap4A) HIT family hydrolase
LNGYEVFALKKTDIFNNELGTDCIGCSVTNGTLIPIGGIIKETANFILHQDPEIPIKGFLIITTKLHLSSITQLQKSQVNELFDLYYDARKALLTFEDILECTLIQEERSKHFHIWILPRYEWMNKQFKNSLSTIRPIMNFAKKNMKVQSNINEIITAANHLREILNDAAV